MNIYSVRIRKYESVSNACLGEMRQVREIRWHLGTYYLPKYLDVYSAFNKVGTQVGIIQELLIAFETILLLICTFII